VAGMRYSEPSIARAARALGGEVERVVGIVLSPQWSDLLMGGYERALREALPDTPVAVPHGWWREPDFIASLAGRVREALADDREGVPVVLTAHSLPRRVFEAEQDYVADLRATAERVADAAGLASVRWRWAYQSAGHTAEEWLRPDLGEVFPDLAREGHRAVLVAPVQFLSDHLEVLYDLDIAAAAQARAAGLAYRRIAMPNTDPPFIDALASVVAAAAATLVRSGERVRAT